VIKNVLNEIKTEMAKHTTYGKKQSYYQEEKYKELIEYMVDRRGVSEDEILVMTGKLGLLLPYYRAFRSIMKKLGYIEYIKDNDIKVIRVTNKLLEKLNSQQEHQDEWDILMRKYGSYIDKYIKELVVTPNTDKKIKISLNELYNNGLMEFVDYAIENYEKVQDYLKQLYDDIYFEWHGEINTKPLILWDFPDRAINKIELNNINANYIGKIVEFEANVVYASEILSIVKKNVYLCKECGNELEIYYKDVFENSAKPICKKCNNQMVELDDKTVYADFQELTVQSTSTTGKTREQLVYYENTEGVIDGAVKVVGYVKVLATKQQRIKELVIQAIHIEQIDNISANISDDDVEEIKEYYNKNNGDLFRIANDLIPNITGNKYYEMLKVAVLLQQCHNTPNRIKGKNPNIHILIVSDPGMGKTEIINKIVELFPNNRKVDGSNTTQAGLVGGVEHRQGKLGSSWRYSLGLISLANGGTVGIDEMPKDLGGKYLNEPMQSGTVSIAKIGNIIQNIKACCSILWGCNPKYERFDRDLPLKDQINIKSSTLSRFDLILLLSDIIENKTEKNILLSMMDDEETPQETLNILRKYILYARSFNPTIPQEIKYKIVDYVYKLRIKHNMNRRVLNSIKKLVVASAKAHLRNEVNDDDFKLAIELYELFLNTFLYDPETGIYDCGKVSGISISEKSKMDEVKKVIDDLCKASITGLADEYEIYDYVKDRMTEAELNEIIKKLIKLGDIDEPRYGKYRLL
jgi:replicative DNA helicase Mcm